MIRETSAWFRGILAVVALTSAACQYSEEPLQGEQAAARAGGSVTVSSADAARIGQKIWQNESAGSVSGLTAWNQGEGFASLGIGHFIWYPAGVPQTYQESFPGFIAYLERRNVEGIPAWLNSRAPCPWNSRQEFQNAQQTSRMKELRRLLQNTVSAQTYYIIERMQAALPKMLNEAPAASRDSIRQRFHALAQTPNGLYALIDYVNFKGEGTNPKERYQGQGWGLLQVLEEIPGQPQGPAAAQAFSTAAKRVLDRRINNAPKPESQWRQGWFNRCDTYARPL